MPTIYYWKAARNTPIFARIFNGPGRDDAIGSGGRQGEQIENAPVFREAIIEVCGRAASSLTSRSTAIGAWLFPPAEPDGKDLSMPDTLTVDQTLRAELDALARRAGLVIPEDRKAALFEAYRDVKRMAALVRRSLANTDEPARIDEIETTKPPVT